MNHPDNNGQEVADMRRDLLETQLATAVGALDANRVKALIAQGARICTTNPLEILVAFAINREDALPAILDIARMLLAAGADPMEKGRHLVPLEWAERLGMRALAETMRTAAGDIRK